MNKRLFFSSFILVVLLFSIQTTFAQRHVKGIKQLSLSGGMTAKGFFAELGYTQHLSNKLYIQGSVIAEPSSTIKGDVSGSDVKYSSYSLLVQGGYNLWNNQTIFLNGRAGIAGGIENGKLAEKPTNYIGSDAQNGFFVAGSIGGEVEIHASDKFVIAPYFNQFLLGVGGDKFGTARYFAGLSLKFGLNQ